MIDLEHTKEEGIHPVCRAYETVDVTVPFNNTRPLKFKAQPRNAFFATVNQVFGGSSQLPTIAEHRRALFRFLNCAQRFDYHVLDSGRKLGGAAEHLIYGSEKRIVG